MLRNCYEIYIFFVNSVKIVSLELEIKALDMNHWLFNLLVFQEGSIGDSLNVLILHFRTSRGNAFLIT